MLVPARDFRGGKVAESNSSLGGTGVSLAFTTALETTEVHLAPASLDAVLDPSEEGREVDHKLILLDTEIVVEQVEKLLLHEVDLGLGEEGTVLGPVLVLGGRIVEVLGSNDERGKEDTVTSAVHALGDTRKTRLQSVEVDKGAEQGGNLHIALLDKDGNEGLEAGKAVDLKLACRVGLGGGNRLCWRRGGSSEGLGRPALNDVGSLLGEVDCIDRLEPCLDRIQA